MIQKSLVLAALGLAGTTHAATNGFVVPYFRGSPTTTSGGWEVFTSASGISPGNAPDVHGNLTGASVAQLNPSAFVTGSGNIYNLTGISSFVLTHNPAEPVGWVTLQVRSLGAELDYSSVRIAYDVGGITEYLAPLGRVELDRGIQLGVNVSSRWDWDANAIGLTSYRIEFGAAGESLSMDSIVLDTAGVGVVPEPSTWALLGLGASVLLWRQRSSAAPSGSRK